MLHRTRHFVALGHSFGVQTDDHGLAERIDWAYEDLATAGTPQGWYEVAQQPGAPYPYTVWWNRELVATSLDQGRALAWVSWDSNRRAAASVDAPVLHAGAVEGGAGAVVVAGRSGAGKTTIVALLVRDGLRYLTDEAVAFDRHGSVVPFPKPLNMGHPTIEILSLARRLPPEFPGEHEEKRLVPASLIAADPVGESRPVTLVVFPERDPGVETTVTEISRAAGVRDLMGNLHAWPQQAPDALDRLAACTSGARCFRVSAPDSVALARSIHNLT